MLPVRVMLFGPPRVEREGQPVALARARGRALLAYLCASRQPHTRDALAALLWPTFAPADAFNNLRRELSLLRRALGSDLFTGDRAHVAIDPDALTGGRLWIDVAAFDAHLTPAAAHGHAPDPPCAACAGHLAAAEALHTAGFLAGFTLPDSLDFDDWLTLTSQRLRAALDITRGQLAAYHLARGEYDRALDYAQRRLVADPLNEPAHRDQLRALLLSGRRAAALRHHEHFTHLLARELALPPAPETLALLALTPAETSSLPTPQPSRRPTPLPAPPTPFLGREAELDILTRLFDDPATRLVTLVGPGGMGKTRLALAWAARLLDAGPARFADGVRFVDLAPVTEVAGVFPALAESLRFPPQNPAEDPRPLAEQIAGYLAGKRLLLLLDNIEHLLAIAPRLVDLLAAAPDVALLTTSRERLNVLPEHVVPIDGLALPPPGADDPAQYAAGRLFLQAAQRVRPTFAALSPAERRDLARICDLVGGMPLAVEMAAAWVDLLSLDEIAAGLERGLSLLETDMADVPERQRSVRAAIDHAWQRLSEDDQRVFARLSVFRGGMTREAAEFVAQATPRQLLTLVRKALLHVDTGGERFRLHELLRQYAAQVLAGDAAATRERHACFYAGLLASSEPRLLDDGESSALARLDADSDNIDAAMHHLLALCLPGPLLHALNGLCLYDDLRLRFRRGWEYCGRVIAAFDPPATGESRLLVARAMHWRVYFHLELLDERDSVPATLAAARALLDQVATSADPLTNDYALNTFLAGDPGYAMDYTPASTAAFEAAYHLFARAGNQWGVVSALQRLFTAYTYGDHKDPESTRNLTESASAFAPTLTNLRLHSQLVADLIIYAVHLDRRALLARMVPEMEKDLARATASASTVEAQILGRYAQPLLYLGRSEEALHYDQSALDARLAFGLPVSMHAEYRRGRLLCHLGRYDEAAVHFRTAQTQARANGSIFVDWLVHVLESMRLMALDDVAAAERLLLAALQLDLAQLAEGDMAGHWANLGLVYCRQGRHDAARPLLARSLRGAVNVYNYLPLIEVLQAIALLLATGRPLQLERAAELYGLLLGQPYYAEARIFHDMTGTHLAAALRALPSEVAAAATARGRSQPLWPAAEALLAEIGDWPAGN